MTITIPFNIGDKITINGETQQIKGIHLYIDKNNEISNIRLHSGKGNYKTVKRKH